MNKKVRPQRVSEPRSSRRHGDVRLFGLGSRGPVARTEPEAPSQRLEDVVASHEAIRKVNEDLVSQLVLMEKREEGLRELVNHDALTGLFNRRYLDDSLARELNHAWRRNASLCVAMLDIDHFKNYNDAYGHDAGDHALRECARVLSRNVRKCDIACRLGGEEFALVFPDSSLVDTRERVEQILLQITHLEMRHNERLIGTMTLSAGVAEAPTHASTAPELLRAADTALYTAKLAGRKRVALYEPSGRSAR